MHVRRILALGAIASLMIVAACSDSGAGSVFGTAGSGGKSPGGSGGNAGSTTEAGSGGDGGSAEAGTAGTAGTGVIIPGGNGGTGTVNGVCPDVPSDDNDGDGWTETQGDCNDCDPNVNPGAVDIVNYTKNTDGTQGDPLPAGRRGFTRHAGECPAKGAPVNPTP